MLEISQVRDSDLTEQHWSILSSFAALWESWLDSKRLTWQTILVLLSQHLNFMSVQFDGWFIQVTHLRCQATPGRIRCLSLLQPSADGTHLNNVTREKMWLVGAFEVLIAMVKGVWARNTRKVAVCSPLTVVEFHSHIRGKATCGDWAPHPSAASEK